MPKQGSRAEVNTFVKGLITEASPLNFPPNASLDEINFELLRDGTRKRRLGLKPLDFAPGGVYAGLTDPAAQSNQFIWQGAGGNTTKDFLVLQIGSHIAIYDLAFTALPALAEYATSFSATVPMSFASVNGRLVVAGGTSKVLVVKYENSAFTYTDMSLKVRDVWGIENVDVSGKDDYHLGTVSLAGIYNFYNQSWGIPRRNKAGTLVNPLVNYRDNLTAYPSNEEVVWTGLAYVPQTGTTDPYEAMYLNLYAERYGAGVGAPKGYFIIDLLARGASRTTELEANYVKYPALTRITPTSVVPPGIVQDLTNGGARVVTEYSGRIFYAGFDGTTTDGDKRSPTLNNYVCFSQLVKNDVDLVKCYQEGDPTSRDASDVVDTDGGFVRISGARSIVSMHTLGSTLVIFADNGVWTLAGGSDYGFSATNFKVDKLSDFGCVAASSIVTDNSNLLFWGSDAMYAISPNQAGTYVVDDITRETIQTLYTSIPLSAKKTVKAAFDLYEKKLRWVYNTGNLFEAATETYELVFDVSIKCFYRNKLNSVSDSTIRVIAPLFYANAASPMFYLYYTYSAYSGVVAYSFAEYGDKTFRDWKIFDGVGTDAKAYMLTGAMLAGDSAVDKQTPYIVTHMRCTEAGADSEGVLLNQSSCLLRTQWDWSNNVSSNKWGSTQEVYGYRHANLPDLDNSFVSGFDVTSTKRKLRGKGKAISLYFETSPDKDCQLLGWSLTINGNAVA